MVVESKSCFVIMPFRDPFNSYYAAIIQPAIRAAGLQSVRADEITKPGAIVGQIWQGIQDATICIAELTEQRPNVMYELGLAHAVGKPVISIVQDMKDVPFDLTHLRHIVYRTSEIGWDEKLRTALAAMLRDTLSDPSGSLALSIRSAAAPVEQPKVPEIVSITTLDTIKRMKQYLEHGDSPISLHDLFNAEVESVYAALLPEHFPLSGPAPPETLAQRIGEYDTATETLATLIAVGSRWGGEREQQLWVQGIERIANPPRPTSNSSYSGYLQGLQLYPALRLLYAGGIGALTARDYATFDALLTKPVVDNEGWIRPATAALRLTEGLTEGTKYLEGERKFTPVSDYLYKSLRNPLQEILPREGQYDSLFDRFEYLRFLIGKSSSDLAAFAGRFLWKDRYAPNTVDSKITAEITAEGADWPLLKTGLFDNSLKKLVDVNAIANAQIAQARGNMM